MGQQLQLVIAVILIGLATAGVVSSPPERVRRVRRHGDRSVLAPSLPLPLASMAHALRARPDALPIRQRSLAGIAAGVITPTMSGMLIKGHDLLPWLAAPLVGVFVIILLGKIERPAARRRRERMVEDLPHVLELMASAMKAGLPLRAAVREVVAVTDGPLADDLSEVVNNVDLGRSESRAWRALRTHSSLGRISVDLARSVDSGTMVVATLRRYAKIARRDRHGVLEARAKTVGVKSVPPLMVCFVPAFFLICVVPSVVSALQHAL